MTRKLLLGLAIAAAIGAMAGCKKEDRATPMKFDSKSQYGNQPQYKGAGQGTQQGTGAQSPSP